MKVAKSIRSERLECRISHLISATHFLSPGSSDHSSHSLLPTRKELLPIPPALTEIITNSLPPSTIHPIAQLAVLVHFGPAVAAPLAARHIDHEIAIRLLVVDLRVHALLALFSILRTGAGREGVEAALLDERDVGPDPWLVGVEVFEGVLLLVFPFHVFLLVEDGVPPDVEEAVGKGGAFDEEGAEVEAGAVLGDEEGDARGEVVAGRGGGDGVEEGGVWGVGDRERVVSVDVAVDVRGFESVEDVALEGVAGFHDEGVEVEPPEPGRC
jgi:hypothetical protein